jgi:hypothetical protein
MTGPIDPIRRAQPTRRMADRRGDERRAAERRAAASDAEARNLPVPAGPVHDHEPKPPPMGPGAFSAQLMGQGGDKRGLRGGPPVLQSARSAYLEAEFSGPRDRRVRKGRIAKTEI